MRTTRHFNGERSNHKEKSAGAYSTSGKLCPIAPHKWVSSNKASHSAITVQLSAILLIMETDISALPTQFDRRAATASFIVNLYGFYLKHGATPKLSAPAVFADLLVPPEHLDRNIVDECRSIAATLALTVSNQCKFWHVV